MFSKLQTKFESNIVLFLGDGGGQLRPARRRQRQGRLRDVPPPHRQNWKIRQSRIRIQHG